MAFQTPSLSEIWTGVKNAMRTYLPGTDAWVEPNNLSVVGRSFSLAVGSVYERINYLYRQLFASTADGFHLEFRHAFEYGISRKAAAPGQGFISFQQTSPFATIPAGYTVTAPNGVSYTFLTTAIPSATGLTSVEIRATTNGAITNQQPQTPMTVPANIAYPSLPSVAYVGVNGIGGGADVESDEDLRARVLFRKRQPPHGGSKSDYEQWALSVPGVTRVFVSPFSTTDPNSVVSPLTLYPLFDQTRVNGIPTAADLAAVNSYIHAVRPVTARCYVAAPTVAAVNVQIGGLQRDAGYIREAIEANLIAMFIERVPVVTVENAFTLPVAWINEAIARADGYERHRLVAPAADVTFSAGQLPILGSVTYTL